MGGVGEERVRVSVIRGREMNKGQYTTKIALGRNPIKRMVARNARYKRQEV